MSSTQVVSSLPPVLSVRETSISRKHDFSNLHCFLVISSLVILWLVSSSFMYVFIYLSIYSFNFLWVVQLRSMVTNNWFFNLTSIFDFSLVLFLEGGKTYICILCMSWSTLKSWSCCILLEAWLRKNTFKESYHVLKMLDSLSFGFSSRVCTGSQFWHNTPEEDRRTW